MRCAEHNSHSVRAGPLGPLQSVTRVIKRTCALLVAAQDEPERNMAAEVVDTFHPCAHSR